MEPGKTQTAGPALEKSQLVQVLDLAGRGNWPNFEPGPATVAPFVTLFLNGPEPHIFKAASILRKSS
jgi:hypothetical protein